MVIFMANSNFGSIKHSKSGLQEWFGLPEMSQDHGDFEDVQKLHLRVIKLSLIACSIANNTSAKPFQSLRGGGGRSWGPKVECVFREDDTMLS